MCAFGADATVPDPSSRIGLTFQKSLGRLPLILVYGIVSRLNVDGDKLMGVLLNIDSAPNALLKNGVAPPGKFLVTKLCFAHRNGGMSGNRRQCTYVPGLLLPGPTDVHQLEGKMRTVEC